MERVIPSFALSKLNLLYVEDEENIRNLFIKMIEKYVKKLFVAKNGREALDIFKSNLIDMIISDIKMPELNGIEMASAIKTTNFEIPVILITAFNDVEYLTNAIDIGIDGYLLKPIDRNKLFYKLNSFAESRMYKKRRESFLKLVGILFNSQKNGLLLLEKDFSIRMFNLSFMEICESIGINSIREFDNLKDCFIDESGNYIDKQMIQKISKENKIIILKISNDINFKYFELGIKDLDEYILMTFNDITNYKLEMDNIVEASMIDSLTKVFNRKKYEIFKSNIKEQKICLIMLDIDDFKQINDIYGHLKGDEVLYELAKTLKNNLREKDIIIRWGGEEFLIILNQLDKSDFAFKVANTLKESIQNIEIEGIEKFTCSFGVVCNHITNPKELDELIGKADDALYLAKKNGKNRVEIYSKS